MTTSSPLYHSLDTAKGEIRLIELQLGNGDDEEIRCNLKTTTIDDAPSYEALSYTWGSAENKKPFIINGQQLLITSNLHEALLALRRPFCRRNSKLRPNFVGPHRTLWIDAVCINQDDIEERNRQVRLMWSIYAKAAEVLVFLGGEEDDGPVAMEMVRLLDLHFEVQIQALLDGRAPESDDETDSEAAVSVDEKGDPPSTVSEGKGKEPAVESGVQGSSGGETSQEIEGPASTLVEPADEELLRQDDTGSETKGKINMVLMTRRPAIVMGSASRPTVSGSSSNPASLREDGQDQELPVNLDRSDLKGLNYIRPVDEEEMANLPFHMLMAMQGSFPEDPAEWVAFQKLMERPWWRRVWVIQEVAAARGQVWVGCGAYWLRWETFLCASHTIANFEDHPFFSPLKRFGAGAKWIQDKSALRLRNDGRLDSWGGLLSILFETHAYAATDPRDRIYALLGFTPSVNIVPDYKKPVAEVYEELARQSIAETGNLMTICFIRKPRILDLPSWVPDFSVDHPLDAYNIACPMGFFGADGNNWHNQGVPSPGCSLNPNDGPGELHVSGFVCDTPLVLGNTWQCTDTKNRQWTFFKTMDEYANLLDETDSARFPNFHGTHYRQECFWRTLIWNASANDRYPAPAAFGEYLDTLRKSDEHLVDIKQPAHHVREDERVLPRGEAQQYYSAFVRNGLNRRFFITQSGRLGSGPPDMQMGDLICVILGSKTPLVLRAKSGVEGEPEKYELVGHVYVHGVMHGEALGDLYLQAEVDLSGRRTMGIRQFCLV
ncbi:heterokaryon incompatibility protein-domain-containing protein [Cercophora newfieldiana]|uniref:Heterokaryon incompatibility protein-domain-containing protein n=1 Tax=Cercophora newfieldiana TaxID=92897 RepID=A0AA40CXC3_9PEZI|nr:heterokaryon incompatibility protein-domain-containing protein [Cercophora newfieldiana]